MDLPPPMPLTSCQLLEQAKEEVKETNFDKNNAINRARELMKSCDEKIITKSPVVHALQEEIKQEKDFERLVYLTKTLEHMMSTEKKRCDM